ncbi:hypothetical protein [Methanomethylophilus alvi]|uniref:hypothetical protein n=1 Tax=Methanomethylophilus alvi TaxID=1291540 RepID=UPI0037DCDF6C
MDAVAGGVCGGEVVLGLHLASLRGLGPPLDRLLFDPRHPLALGVHQTEVGHGPYMTQRGGVGEEFRRLVVILLLIRLACVLEDLLVGVFLGAEHRWRNEVVVFQRKYGVRGMRQHPFLSDVQYGSEYDVVVAKDVLFTLHDPGRAVSE